jgi:hypothetical protein
MTVTLQNPIVAAPITNLAVTFISMSFGPTDAQTVVTMGYAPSTSQGVLTGPPTTVTLQPADLAAFQAASGTIRQKAEAALQSNLGATAAGTAT